MKKNNDVVSTTPVKRPIYKRAWFIAVLVVLGMSLIGSFNKPDKTPPDSTTPPVGQNTDKQPEPAKQPEPEKKPEPAKEPEKAPEPKITTYKSGMHKVGTDIPAGEYLITSSGKSSAYMQVSKDSSGTLDSILTNDNFKNTRYMSVVDGNYVTLTSATMIAVADATPQVAVDGKLPEGMYKVGFDIPAGEYKVTAGENQGYCEVASDSAGGFESIITNDNFQGEKYITVADGNYLKLTRCELIVK